MVRGDIRSAFLVQKRALRDLLSRTDNVALTIDIWSDRRKRAYLGITAHFIEMDEMLSASLCCKQIEGVLNTIFGIVHISTKI